MRAGLFDLLALLAFALGALLDAIDHQLLFSTAGWACVGLATVVVALIAGDHDIVA